MIKVNKIVPQTVEAFDPDGNSLGFINEYELLDLRVQILKEKAWGYYLMFNGIKIRIDRKGTLESYPKGFFNLYGDYLSILVLGE